MGDFGGGGCNSIDRRFSGVVRGGRPVACAQDGFIGSSDSRNIATGWDMANGEPLRLRIRMDRWSNSQGLWNEVANLQELQELSVRLTSQGSSPESESPAMARIPGRSRYLAKRPGKTQVFLGRRPRLRCTFFRLMVSIFVT